MMNQPHCLSDSTTATLPFASRFLAHRDLEHDADRAAGQLVSALRQNRRAAPFLAGEERYDLAGFLAVALETFWGASEYAASRYFGELLAALDAENAG